MKSSLRGRFPRRFFHADMHPGNIFVAIDEANRGKYIALDFGIVGTPDRARQGPSGTELPGLLPPRDYRRVAEAHIEAGWAPPDTRADEFEAAIRAVCDRFSTGRCADFFGSVLLRLFQTSRRFNIEPATVGHAAKTLLNIEGLGRQLDPRS